MKWLIGKWFRVKPDPAVQSTRLTGEAFRQNVRTCNAEWLAQEKVYLVHNLRPGSTMHPGNLMSQAIKLSRYALQLAMFDWRQGLDPRPHLVEIEAAFAQAIAVRPDILLSQHDPSFVPVVASLMGWDLPVKAAPSDESARRYALPWMEQTIAAALTDPAFQLAEPEPSAKEVKFVNQCVDDYLALLTDRIAPEDGIQRCIKNYNRRATHPTFKSVTSYLGGGEYNELFVDYTLAAILKKRGLTSGTVHDWVWG